MKKSEAPIHKAFLNAQNGDREIDSFYATTYMMDTEELESYLKLNEEEIQRAYRNILKIKDMCEDYSLLKPLKIPQLLWKKNKVGYIRNFWYEKIPYIEKFDNSEHESDRHLARMIIEALEDNPEVEYNEETFSAVNECLKISWASSQKNNADWSAYYLNLQKLLKNVGKRETLVGTRACSWVGLILLYLLENPD